MLNWHEIDDGKTYSRERVDLLLLLEGSTLAPYVDTVGDPTIGIGFNLVYNLEPVLRVIVGKANWSDALLARLETEIGRDYDDGENARLQANLDRVMRMWHDTKDADVPTQFRFGNAGQVRKALDRIAPSYDARIDDWIAGIPESREREALFSLCWNGPSLLGPKLKAAIEAGDRAEAWYEIRYNSNASGDSGLANRRYVEAETFALFDREGKASFAEALQAGGMLARHHALVLDYEARHDADAAGAIKGMETIDAIGGEMLPAVKAALRALGLAAGLKVEELLAASAGYRAVSGDGTGEDGRGNDDDLILGSSGRDRLSGNSGSDILAGLAGADRLTGGAGGDLFVFRTVADSGPSGSDRITDFGSGADRIAFSALGDLTLLTGEGAKFSGAGDEIRWYRDGGSTIVEVDLDGDRNADLTLLLDGRHRLDGDDFLL